jgi:hypothetical protein
MMQATQMIQNQVMPEKHKKQRRMSVGQIVPIVLELCLH